jgi:hypothetical protein
MQASWTNSLKSNLYKQSLGGEGLWGDLNYVTRYVQIEYMED